MAQLQPMKLESRDISSISSANELFGSEKGLLVVRPGRGLAPWFCVPDGCYALVQRFGKDMDYAEGQPVWPPGYHWGPPWVQVSHLVTMQSVVFNMPVKDCKTQDNVTVTINLAICFRIKADPRKGEDPYLARNFVYKVTPRGLEQQLIDACEEATRKVRRAIPAQFLRNSAQCSDGPALTHRWRARSCTPRCTGCAPTSRARR